MQGEERGFLSPLAFRFIPGSRHVILTPLLGGRRSVPNMQRDGFQRAGERLFLLLFCFFRGFEKLMEASSGDCVIALI